MSQSGTYDTSTILADIETLTGNAGGAVGPDAAGNVDLLGAGGVTVTGTPGSNLLTITDTGIDQNQIIYVGKHGNDANDGLTIEKAKLTFGSAITATGGGDFVIWCFDDGNYTEDLTFVGTESIWAPNARIIGSHILATTNYMHTNFTVPTGTTAFTYNSAGLITIINTRGLGLQGTANGINCLAGTVILIVDNVGLTNGNLIASTTVGNVNIQFNQIDIGGTGSVFSCVTGGIISATGSKVCNTGAGDGQLFETSGGGAPEISATISAVNLEKLSDITAGSIVKLNAGDLNGSLAEAGAGSVSMGGASRIDNVPIGDVTPSNATFTTLEANTSLTVSALGLGVMQTDGTGLVSSSTGTDGQILIANTAGTAPVWANITSTGGTVDVTNGAGTINLEISGGIEWTESTGAAQAMVVNHGYITNRGAGVTATLPASAAIGDIIEVVGKNAGGWTIAQNAGQTIHYISVSTTTGVGGSLASTQQYDSVCLVCITANTDFAVKSSCGNITVT